MLGRRASGRVIAGVAGGVADRLRLADAHVRAAFVVLASIWGLGVVVYLVIWLLTTDRVADAEPPETTYERSLGAGTFFIGVLVLLGSLGLLPPLPVVAIAGALSFGLAALYSSGTPSPIASFLDPKVEHPSRLRIGVGLLLLMTGLALLASSVGTFTRVGAAAAAVTLTGLGIAVAFGPRVYRMARELNAERTERIRQEERAEVAAHLHDSVLQTLALIQRSDDPRRAAMLARVQERDLRRWLYGTAPLDGVDLLSTALEETAAAVEADHGVRVEVVTVGDAPVSLTTRPLLLAAREAMVNAGKHAGVSTVSVLLEAGEEKVEVWVTDQGKGFDPSTIPPDRRGISHSMTARVIRAGGDVTVESSPGEGSEIHLSVPVS